VHRDVRLVRAGGVDPNAKGAVVVELDKAKAAHPAATPDPLQQAKKATAAGDNSHLPDFSHIISGSDK
jgi:hypothetical protein